MFNNILVKLHCPSGIIILIEIIELNFTFYLYYYFFERNFRQRHIKKLIEKMYGVLYGLYFKHFNKFKKLNCKNQRFLIFQMIFSLNFFLNNPLYVCKIFDSK